MKMYKVEREKNAAVFQALTSEHMIRVITDAYIVMRTPITMFLQKIIYHITPIHL